MDYYISLELQRNCTHKEILTQYRKLALKWHPSQNQDDLQTATKNFHRISEAYEVLSNPALRVLYDALGQDKLKEGVVNSSGQFLGGYKYHGNAQAIFLKFIEGTNPFSSVLQHSGEIKSLFGSAIGGLNSEERKPPEVLRTDLICTLDELYNGVTKELTYNKSVLTSCQRKTQIQETNKFIEIHKGYKHNTELIFSKEGNEHPQHPTSDLIIKIIELPHPNFQRKGNNLIYTAQVTLLQALEAQSVQIKTLDGRELSIAIDEIITPKSFKVVENEGMPILKQSTYSKRDHLFGSDQNSVKRGRLIIKFKIIMPKFIPSQAREQFVELISENFQGQIRQQPPKQKAVLDIPELGLYEGEINTQNQADGQGSLKEVSGNSYEGQFVNNQYNGTGTYYFTNGDKYQGQWFEGARQGYGKLEYKEGKYYQGNFQNNVITGQGFLKNLDGSRYKGEFENGLFHGQGMMVYPNNDSYTGNWEFGEIQGYGKLITQNGFVYQGEFVDGKKQGFGILRFPDDSKYEGMFFNNQRNGQGTFSGTNGKQIEGIFENNTVNGFAIQSSANGDRFEGDFRNFKKHGKGTIFKANGDKFIGNFEFGKKTGQGEYIHADGRIYTGDFQHNQKQGRGKIQYPNQSVYEGQFEKDQRSGVGTLTFQGGQSYSGRWKDDKPHDVEAVWKSGDGKQYKTHWNNGELAKSEPEMEALEFKAIVELMG